jgi:hypothetical protein
VSRLGRLRHAANDENEEARRISGDALFGRLRHAARDDHDDASHRQLLRQTP